MIEQNSIENLKSRLDIVEVVGLYIELKKSGANYKARCPFHSEDTPSFVVSPAKQIYHCFGCGAGGDAIKFVMDYEKINYPEAIEKLADEFNIPLIYTRENRNKREDRKVLEMVNIHFKQNLNSEQRAKEYLKQRGVYDSSIEKFEIGYASSSNDTINFLRANLLPIEDALKCGIVARDERGGVYSRFVERITFPIYAPNAKLVGFGGRTISNHPAKYINSPQTYLFNKSRLLYGYHLSFEAIRQKKRIIVTEGYLDVIMLHQAGFKECVATLGTALTIDHLPLLRRGEPKVILSYDGDSAGVEAAFKASKLLSNHSIDGGVVIFDGGKDPADMVKTGEINALNELFSTPKPFIEFVLEQISKKYNLNDPLQKERALKEGTEYLKTLSNILQEEYRGYFASLLNVDKRIVKLSKHIKKYSTPIQKREDIAELSIIKTILARPELLDIVLDCIDSEVFNTHKVELEKVLSESEDKEVYFSGLLIRDDVRELDEEELKKQLSFLLSGYYKLQLDKIKYQKDLLFEKKSFLMRKLQDKIAKLKRGELVVYERF